MTRIFLVHQPKSDCMGQLSYFCFICKLSGLLMSKGGPGPVQMKDINTLKRYTGKFDDFFRPSHSNVQLFSPVSEAREEMAEYLIIVQDHQTLTQIKLSAQQTFFIINKIRPPAGNTEFLSMSN